jgi:dihydroflavonol-4-reductase
MPGSQGMHDIHTSAIRAILASADRGARIVHTSSILAVGGTTDGQILDEESAFPCLDGSADYLRAKRASEIEALSAGNRDLIVTNPGFLFGPMDYGRSIMGLLCSRFWKGRLFVGTRGGLNVVDVRDVAEGHLRAAEFGRAGRRYILGGANLSMAALMRELADVAQYRPRLLATAPHWLGMSAAALAESRSRLTGRPAMPSFQILRLLRLCWYVRSDRAGVELGYTTRPLSETLADTYRWHHDAGTRPRGINRWLMRPAA